MSTNAPDTTIPLTNFQNVSTTTVKNTAILPTFVCQIFLPIAVNEKSKVKTSSASSAFSESKNVVSSYSHNTNIRKDHASGKKQ